MRLIIPAWILQQITMTVNQRTEIDWKRNGYTQSTVETSQTHVAAQLPGTSSTTSTLILLQPKWPHGVTRLPLSANATHQFTSSTTIPTCWKPYICLSQPPKHLAVGLQACNGDWWWLRSSGRGFPKMANVKNLLSHVNRTACNLIHAVNAVLTISTYSICFSLQVA